MRSILGGSMARGKVQPGYLSTWSVLGYLPGTSVPGDAEVTTGYLGAPKF